MHTHSPLEFVTFRGLLFQAVSRRAVYKVVPVAAGGVLLDPPPVASRPKLWPVPLEAVLAALDTGGEGEAVGTRARWLII